MAKVGSAGCLHPGSRVNFLFMYTRLPHQQWVEMLVNRSFMFFEQKTGVMRSRKLEVMVTR